MGYNYPERDFLDYSPNCCKLMDILCKVTFLFVLKVEHLMVGINSKRWAPCGISGGTNKTH
jgi:hypothetical protein